MFEILDRLNQVGERLVDHRLRYARPGEERAEVGLGLGRVTSGGHGGDQAVDDRLKALGIEIESRSRDALRVGLELSEVVGRHGRFRRHGLLIGSELIQISLELAGLGSTGRSEGGGTDVGGGCGGGGVAWKRRDPRVGEAGRQGVSTGSGPVEPDRPAGESGGVHLSPKLGSAATAAAKSVRSDEVMFESLIVWTRSVNVLSMVV